MKSVCVAIGTEESATAKCMQAAKVKRAQHAAHRVEYSRSDMDVAGTEGDIEDTNPVCQKLQSHFIAYYIWSF